MSITAAASIIADQAAMRLAISDDPLISPASTWRSVRDIILDWMVIGLAVWTTLRTGGWAAPLAIVVIGNRQRALGNLLHEASHQNLSPRRDINDMIARLLLAAPLFNSLSLYRSQHARHHAWLGDPAHDPDFIACAANDNDQWFNVYIRVLLAYPIWTGSLLGNLAGKQLSRRQWLAIACWWICFETLLAVLLDPSVAWLFFLLWMIARGTVFHAVTTFREMTDHYGLTPKGIFQYTRDIPTHGFVSILLHPHYNGYHLTHHLYPHIPYHQLPRAHAQLMRNSMFRQRAVICHTYLNGKHAGVNGWGASHV
jgi:fatty acid desaturase